MASLSISEKHQISMATKNITALEKSKMKRVQNAKSKESLLEKDTFSVSGKYNMDATEKRRQESINYVEIKFRECEKSRRKNIEAPISSVFPPSKNPMRKNHYNHERKMNHFPRGTYTTKKALSTMSPLAKTMSQSREKYSTSSKLSESRKLKSFQRTAEIKHYQRAAESVNEPQTMNMDTSSLNTRKSEIKEEVTPDIRFNRILDKLRKAADEL